MPELFEAHFKNLINFGHLFAVFSLRYVIMGEEEGIYIERGEKN
jgi:hypothetical protein